MTWDFDPVAFSISGRPVRYYGLLFLGGFGLAVLAFDQLQRFYRRRVVTEVAALAALLAVVVGGRLAYLLFYASSAESHWALSAGGLSSHGCLVGLLSFAVVFARVARISLFQMLDPIAVVASIPTALNRLGNFLNSEIVGTATQLPWGVVFARVDSVPRHPVQLYECLWLIALGILMAWGTIRRGWLARRGLCVSLWAALYFAGRFALEPLKAPLAPWDQGPLRLGQWLSLPVLALAALTLVWSLRRPIAQEVMAPQQPRGTPSGEDDPPRC